MLECWKYKAAERPTFANLVTDIASDLGDMAGYMNFNSFTDSFFKHQGNINTEEADFNRSSCHPTDIKPSAQHSRIAVSEEVDFDASKIIKASSQNFIDVDAADIDREDILKVSVCPSEVQTNNERLDFSTPYYNFEKID